MCCTTQIGMPKMHPDFVPKRAARYNSFVDCPSNPEMFVVQKYDAMYPAYVIHYS